MKNAFLKFGTVNSTIAVIGILYALLIVTMVWKPAPSEPYMRTIDGDGKGYYMYLPSIFISGDFGNEPADYRYLLQTSNGILNRYNVGTPLLMSPFFAATCLYYDLQGISYEGYEQGFQKTVNFAALFYLLLGLYAFSELLRSFYFKNRTIAAVMVLTALGTNLLFYTASAPAFSHVYSFFAISFLLLFVKRFFTGRQTKYLILCAVFLGLTLLIRPFNGLVILAFPFLANIRVEFAEAIKSMVKKPMQMLLSAAIVMGIFGIQQALWFVQTGNFVLYGYSNEGFYFDKPQIINVLLSFRKGLFVYTPILLLSLPGFIVMFKKNQFRLYSYLIFCVLLVYFISSWWIWYYGPSFGHRVFIDFYPLLFIPIAYLIEALQNRFAKYVIVLVSIGCIILNLLQSYQYRNGILSQSDMNKSKYTYVFGKTDEIYNNVLGGVSDMKPYHREQKIVLRGTTHFDNDTSLFRFSKSAYDSLSNSMVADYSGREFNVVAAIPLDSSFVNGREAYLELDLELFELSAVPTDNPALIVFDLRDSIGNPYYYIATPMKDVPVFNPNTWQRIRYTLVLPIRATSDQLSVYFWNRPLAEFHLDNITIEISIFD